MRLRSFFLDHPASVGESYLEHMGNALGFARSLLGAAFAVAVHSVFPGIFQKTASAIIARLHQRMVVNRMIDKS